VTVFIANAINHFVLPSVAEVFAQDYVDKQQRRTGRYGLRDRAFVWTFSLDSQLIPAIEFYKLKKSLLYAAFIVTFRAVLVEVCGLLHSMHTSPKSFKIQYEREQFGQ